MFMALMQGGSSMIDPTLRHWLWLNFGWDIYEWEDGDVRF